MTTKTIGPASRRARLAGHLFTVAAIALWFALGGIFESYQLPGPVPVFERLGQFFGDWHELKHMFFSFGHIIAAVLLSFLIGSACAFLAFYVPDTKLAIHGRLSPFLNSYSGIGWTMLAIIWFGINAFAVVFVISMVLIPFAIINMREGLDAIDREVLEMSESFGRNRWRQFYKIILPALYPFIFATIRISFGVAWKVALTAEFFAGGRGFGYLLSFAQNDFDIPLIFAIILIIVVFVYSTDRFVFAPIQARLARHHGA